MSKLITRIKRLALALCFVTPLVSWAAGGSATNPVTGAAESYQYYFVGGDSTNPGDWATQANWKVGSDDSDYTTLNKNYAPAVYIDNHSGETYGTVLFDGVNCPDNKTITSTDSKIEGWTFKIGAYNGVDVTIDHLDLWSAGQGNVGSSAASVDATSKITIKEINNGKNWPSTIDYYIAANEGLTYKGAFRPTGGSDYGTIRYWFAGAGSVVYEDVVEKCAHVIKQADVTLTGGAKEVKSKTLVTFASTTKTFSADNALITVKNSGGTAVRGVRLSSVTSGTTTLTTDNNVGDCELVQTATGVLLYYVDGDAAAITYTPSISINFRDSDSNTLNTFEDVGLTGYAVPGTVWNNYTIQDNANAQTFDTVNQIDSAGVSSEVPGATVTVSGHRGRYYCSSLDASADPRRGYIDDGNSAETMSPSVTITGIPYDNYRVIVYHATDSNGALFGYDTINGTDFTYVDGRQTIGTTGWGASGAQNTALPIQEGVNTLVSGILSGSTVTMVAHRMSNPTARGCFAAIQVVEVAASDSDLVINVNGNTEYEVTESKQYDNVIIAGTGNLTFTGEGTITADTLNIDPVAAVVKVNSTQLSVSKVIGNGVALYEGALPPDGDGWWTDASEWKGTVWIKNYTTKLSAFESNKYGNNSSVLRLTGLNGYLQRTTTAAPYTHMTLELVDDGDTPAFTYNDGWGGSAVYISALKGNGTFAANSAGNGEIVYVADPSAFTGSFNLTHKKVQLGGSAPNGDNQYWDGKILIPSGATATVASGKTWYAGNGIEIEGTLTSNGALDVPTGKSIAVSGSLVNTGTIGIYGGVSVAATGTLTNNGRIWAVGGITVNGTLKTDKYTTTDSGRFGSGTAITLGDTGVFELASTGNTDDGSTSYSQITGTGKIKYSGSGYWVLSSNHPTAITLEAEQASALVVPAAGATIGSLTGTKGFRSDWGTTPAAGRYLTIKQFKDTSWSGSINQTGEHRLTGVVVDPGESTTGTLEVTGTQTASATLTVNGSVNLTGTWKGATTVAGTFGGTGTLTGNLTFSDGATFKAFASDEDGLSVSGAFTYPAEGKVAVDVSALTLDSETEIVLLTGTTEAPDATKFDVTGTPGYGLKAVGYALTLYAVPTVSITVPSILNTTVTVKIGDNTIGTSSGDYNVAPDSVVTVTYAAVDGYAISGTTEYTIDTSKSETTFDPAGKTEVKQYVASITAGETTTKYTTLQAAIDAVAQNKDIVLLANEADGATVAREVTFSIVPGEYTYGDIAAGGDYILTVTPQEGKTRYSFAQAVIAVTINEVRTLYTMMTAPTGIEAANAGPIGTTIEILSGDSASYAEYLPMFDYNSETRVYTKVADPVAAVYSGVLQLGVYRTLAEAVTAATSGQTVKLLENVSLTERLFVNAGATPAYDGTGNRYATTSENKAITLDLNGFDITSTSNIALAGGSLTITGTGMISTTTPGCAPVEIRGTGNLAAKRTLVIGQDVTLAGPCYGLNIFGSNTKNQKNVIDVTVDGTINGMLFVLGNIDSPENEVNVVVNGTVDASQAVGEEAVHTGIAQAGYSTVTVNDGAVVKGESGIETRAGSLVVNGGEITATENTESYAKNGSGMTTKGAAVAVAQHGTKRAVDVEINGGSLTGVKQIVVTDAQNSMTDITVQAATAYTASSTLPEGYKWSEPVAGVCALVACDYVAQIEGGAKFEDFTKAVAAAADGDTVTLLKDIALTERLYVNAGAEPVISGGRFATTSENKALTLNLGGKNITSTSNIALAGGSLTITGTGTISTTTSGWAPVEIRGTGNLAAKRTLVIGENVTLSGPCYGLNIFGSNTKNQKNVIDVTVDGTINGMLFVLGNIDSPENEVDVVVNGTVDASQAVGEEAVHTGIAQAGYSTVTVNAGAVVTGESGIETRAGELIVYGGTITATAIAESYAKNGSGMTTKGAAVAVAQHGTKRAVNAEIRGGTLTGVKKIVVTDAQNNMTGITVQAAEANTGSTTIPAGYQWSTAVQGICTLEVIPETPVIDPDSDEPVEVPVDKNADEADAQAAADAIPVKTTTEIEEILDDVVPTTPGKTAQEEYQANFKRVVAQDDDGNWVVTETTIKEEVVEEASDEVLDALEEVTATDDEITIVAKPGLQYGLVAGDDLGTVNSGTPQTMIRAGADGKVTLTIPQIEGEDIMFFKLVISQ